MSLKDMDIDKNKLYLIFQPHTYTRTKALFEDFVDALASIDNLILIEIYPAREQNIYNISSKDIVDRINEKYNKNAKYIECIDDSTSYLIDILKNGDIVVTMGAGDVYKIGEKLINHFNNKNNI